MTQRNIFRRAIEGLRGGPEPGGEAAPGDLDYAYEEPTLGDDGLAPPAGSPARAMAPEPAREPNRDPAHEPPPREPASRRDQPVHRAASPGEVRPVGYFYYWGGQKHFCADPREMIFAAWQDGISCTPLYEYQAAHTPVAPAPVARQQPLTQEQIVAAIEDAGLRFTKPDLHVARAVERRHGIREAE